MVPRQQRINQHQPQHRGTLIEHVCTNELRKPATPYRTPSRTISGRRNQRTGKGPTRANPRGMEYPYIQRDGWSDPGSKRRDEIPREEDEQSRTPHETWPHRRTRRKMRGMQPSSRVISTDIQKGITIHRAKGWAHFLWRRDNLERSITTREQVHYGTPRYM